MKGDASSVTTVSRQFFSPSAELQQHLSFSQATYLYLVLSKEVAPFLSSSLFNFSLKRRSALHIREKELLTL